MSDEVKPTNQQQTPPADPAPPTPAPAPPEPPKEEKKPDPLLAQLFSDLGVEVSDKPAEIQAVEPAKVDPQPEPTVAETAHAAVTPTAEPSAQTPPPVAPDPAKPVETPATVQHVDVAELIASGIRRGFEEQAKVKTPEPPKEEPKPAEDLTGWNDDEVDALELAKYAEVKNPEAYKGQADKVRKFKKGLDDLIASKRSDDGEWNPDSDADFRKWVEDNKPKYHQGDARKLDRERIIEEAEQRSRKVIEQERAQIQSKFKEVEMKPVIERGVSEFNRKLESYLVDPNEKDTLAKVSEVYKAEGIASAEKKYPLHVREVVPIIQTAGRAAGVLMSYKTGLVELNQNDPLHRFVGDFVKSNDAWTASRPESERTKVVEINGRQIQQRFIPSDDYAKLQAANDPSIEGYWTWTPQAYLQMLAVQARRQAGEAAARVDQYLSAYQTPKVADPPPAKPAVAPKPDNTPPVKPDAPSPKATVSASPGASTGGSTPSTGNGAMPAEYMKALGLTTIS